MTSTTSCAAAAIDENGAVHPSSLVTAVADALDDLGLRRLVVGGISNQDTCTTQEEQEQEEEEEQAYHRAVWRAYQQDKGGLSLTVARRLLGMALTTQEMRSILHNRSIVGRGGIMTWGDIEAVCRQMGCLTRGYEYKGTGTSGEESSKHEGEDNDKEDNAAKAHRKLELTLFLATEAECRRISKPDSGSILDPSSPSHPTTNTSPAPAAAKPNANLLQTLIEISPPGAELSDDQLRSALQQSTHVPSDQIDKIVECNRALLADYSLRKTMMMKKFDATAIAMARSRRHVKSDSDRTKVKSEGTGAQGDGEEEEAEEEAAMDPVEMEIREIASSLANLKLSSCDDTNSKAVDSGDGLLQQFLLPSTRFGPVTQTQIMKADIGTYDRGGRVDQDDRNSMPAWQKTRRDGPPPRTPPRTPGGGRSPATGKSKKKRKPMKESTPKRDEEMKNDIAHLDSTAVEVAKDIEEVETPKEAPTSTPKNKKNKTPKKQSTPKQKEETEDVIDGSEVKIVQGIEEVEKTKEAPSSTPKNARRRRGKGKSKGDTSRPSNAPPDSTNKHGKVRDIAASETNTPAKPSELGSEHAKDAPETSAANSSAKKKRRRPKKSNGEATPNNGNDQRSTTDKDAKGSTDKRLESPKGQAPQEDQADGKKRSSRRRNRGRGKPGQKSNEAQEGKG